MMRHLKRNYLVLLPAVLLSIAGCVPQTRAPEAPAAPATKDIVVPTITSQSTSHESQTKGGLTISIAPAVYTTEMSTVETLTQTRARFGAPMVGPMGSPTVYALHTTQTMPAVTPNLVKFTVTINNQMPRVFHGAGTVVQFNIGGRLLAVDGAAYANLQNAIVPPQSQQQFDIFGPTLDQLPAGQSSMALFFYDVVTAQNDAGVVTEKQNYNWDFSINMTPKSVEVPAPTSEVQRMSAAYFQQEQYRLHTPGAMQPMAPGPQPGQRAF